MSRSAAVIDPSGNYEENIERLSKHLGRGKVRRAIFNVIYGRGHLPKPVDAILVALGDGFVRQSVINELNELSKHNLVVATADGKSPKSTGKLYSKVDFIRANKEKIVKFADNPKAAAKLPTKRRPQTASGITYAKSLYVPANSNLVVPKAAKTLKVLFLTATPSSQKPLRTDAEVSLVQGELRGSKLRDKIDLLPRPAASPKTLLDGLNDHSPQVVHFSGHGGRGGVWFDDGKVVKSVGGNVSFDLLADILGSTSNPPILLVLNSCDTLEGAEALLGSVQIVIAMSSSISDVGAATFAAQLYAAIASGETVLNALKQGRVALKGALLNKDAALPDLISRSDIDASKVRLVR